MKVKSESEVAQSCLTQSDPMECSLPGSSIHGIFQARVLEWGAIAFSEHNLQQLRITMSFTLKQDKMANQLYLNKKLNHKYRKANKKIINKILTLNSWDFQAGLSPAGTSSPTNITSPDSRDQDLMFSDMDSGHERSKLSQF